MPIDDYSFYMDQYEGDYEVAPPAAPTPTGNLDAQVAARLASLGIEDPTLSKRKKLSDAEADKRARLRQDDKDYGNDSGFVRGLKGVANEFLDHDNQLAINVDGKRYTGQNKRFNDEDLTNVWNDTAEDPNGDKVLYYLRKNDGLDEQGNVRWLYKPGIADVGASDRYAGQLDDNEWELIGEKRFNGANRLEEKIHGNKTFLQDRAFDYGRSSEDERVAEQRGLAFNDFGAGKSELYTRDILGLDNNDVAQYGLNKANSRQAMMDKINAPYQREDTFESLDALGAGAQTLAGKVVKGVGSTITAFTDPDMTGDGAVESYGKQLMATANQDWGYNDKGLKEGSKLIREGVTAMMEDDIGGKLAGAYNFLKGTLKAAPQAVAGSAPEMTAYLGSGWGLAARVTALALVNTNDALDQREEANGGRKATGSEQAAALAGQLFASAIDAGSFRFISKLGEPLMIARKGKPPKDFKDAVDSIPDATKWEMAKALVMKPAGRGGAAMATEAVQETTTEAIRMLTESLGTDKHGNSAMEILQSAEGKGRLANAAALGSAGGYGFNVVSSAAQTVGDVKRQRNIAKSEEAAKTAGDYVESREDAEEGKVLSDMGSELLEEEYNLLKKSLADVDTAESLDQVKEVIRTSSLGNGFKEVLSNLVNAEPGISADKLRAEARKLMSKQLDETALAGKRTRDTSTSLDKALKDEHLEKAEPTDTSVEQADIAEAKSKEEAPIEVPETSFAQSMPTEWNDETKNEVYAGVKKLLDEVPSEEGKEDYAKRLEEAQAFVSTLGKDRSDAGQISEILNERLAETKAPKEVEPTEVKEDTYKDKDHKGFAAKVTKFNPSVGITEDVTLEDFKAQQTRLEKAIELVKEKKDSEADEGKKSKGKNSRKAYQKSISQMEKQLAEVTEEIAFEEQGIQEEADLQASEDTKAKTLKEQGEDSKAIKENKKAIKVHNAQASKLDKAVTLAKENLAASVTPAEKAIAQKQLEKAQQAYKDFDSAKPEKATKGSIAFKRKAQAARDKKARKGIRQEVREAATKVKEAKEKQEREDKIREDYRDEKGLETLEHESKTLQNEVDTMIEESSQKEKVPQSEIANLNAKMKALDAVNERIENFDEGDFKEAQEFFAADKKIDEERATQEKATKEAKEKKAHESKQESVSKKASAISKAISKYMKDKNLSKPERDEKGKLTRKGKKQSKAIKDLFHHMISRTGTETLKLMKGTEFTADITDLTGIEHADLVKEVKDVEAKRAQSKKTIGIGQQDVAGYDPQSAFIHIMKPRNEALTRLKDDKDREEPRTEQERKDDVALLNSTGLVLSEFMQEMSRAQFANFLETGEFNSLSKEAGVPLDIKGIAKVLNGSEEALNKQLETTIAFRKKYEDTKLSRRKYVANIARAKNAHFEEDIDLAKQMNTELLKKNEITQEQHDTFVKLLDRVAVRSKETQKEIAEKIAEENAKEFDKLAKDMTPESKAVFDKLPPFMRMQLAAITGVEGDILDRMNAQNVVVTKDAVEITGEC